MVCLVLTIGKRAYLTSTKYLDSLHYSRASALIKFTLYMPLATKSDNCFHISVVTAPNRKDSRLGDEMLTCDQIK